MSVTLPELQERLKQEDEVTLLETLDINSEDIVERFVDVIEDKFEQLEFEFMNEDEE